MSDTGRIPDASQTPSAIETVKFMGGIAAIITMMSSFDFNTKNLEVGKKVAATTDAQFAYTRDAYLVVQDGIIRANSATGICQAGGVRVQNLGQAPAMNVSLEWQPNYGEINEALQQYLDRGNRHRATPYHLSAGDTANFCNCLTSKLADPKHAAGNMHYRGVLRIHWFGVDDCHHSTTHRFEVTWDLSSEKNACCNIHIGEVLGHH